MSANRKQLYDLIAKMTPSEKRYFKIYANRHVLGDENGYVLLFDIISDMIKKKEVYSELTLANRFKNKLPSKRLDLYKSNLYKKILDCLIEFNKEDSLDFKLRSIATKADILNQKGLPYQALKFIRRGIAQSEEYEKWYFLLAFLELENSINYSLQKLSSGHEKQQLIVAKALNLKKFQDLQSKMWEIYLEIGLPSNEEDLARYEEVISNDLMESEANALSYKAKTIYFYLLQFYYGMKENITKSCFYGEKLITHLESAPRFIKENGDMYFRANINLQFALLRLGKYHKILVLIRKCRKAFKYLSGNKALISTIGLSLYINEYKSLFGLNPQHDMHELISRMRKHFKQNEKLLTEPTKYLFYWHNAIYHFNLKQYSESLEWINLVQSVKSDFREDIQALSRILLLIIHFELGNKMYLISCLKSTYRFLKKKNRYYDIEKLFFQFIKNQNRSLPQDTSQMRKQFTTLLNDLQSLIGDSYSHLTFRSVNLVQWVEDRIQDKRYVSV